MSNAEKEILATLAEKEEVKIIVSKHHMDLLREGLSLTQPRGYSRKNILLTFIRP